MAAYRAFIITEDAAMTGLVFSFYLPYSPDGSGREYYEEYSECRFAMVTPLPTEAGSSGAPSVGNPLIQVIQ